jgi:hypothetical protein
MLDDFGRQIALNRNIPLKSRTVKRKKSNHGLVLNLPLLPELKHCISKTAIHKTSCQIVQKSRAGGAPGFHGTD